MRYSVEVEERTYEVEIDGEEVRIDGRIVEVDFEPSASPGSDLFHLILDGRSHSLRLRRLAERGAWEAESDGRTYRLTALNERRRAIRKVAGAAAAAAGPIEIRAPMPGLVVAVHVSEGDEVEKGRPLLVIEAMKMENELQADAAGRVTGVRVSAGQAVEKGEPLVVVEADAGE